MIARSGCGVILSERVCASDSVRSTADLDSLPSLNVILALPLLGVAAALGCFVFAISEALTAGRGLDRREWLIATRLTAAAFGLRVAVAIGTYVVLPYGYFAPDEIGYARSGLALSKQPLDLSQALSAQGWLYFNAASQQLFGDDHLLPRLWNAGVGSLTVLLCFVLATRVVSGIGARFTALVVAFLPTLVMWSTLNLKDADVWCLILSGLLLIVRLQAGWRWRSIAALGIVVVLLASLRQFAAASLVLATAVGLLSPHLSRRRLITAAGVAAAVAVVVALTVGERVYTSLHLDMLAHLRHALAVGARSAVDPDPGLQTLHGAIAFLPRGVFDLLIRPFPWEVPGALKTGVAIDIVLEYAVLVAAIIGIAYSIKRRPVESAPLIGIIICLIVGYGLVLSNLGTIYRERAQIVVVLCVFVGAAYDVLGRGFVDGQLLETSSEGALGNRGTRRNLNP